MERLSARCRHCERSEAISAVTLRLPRRYARRSGEVAWTS